MGFYVYVFKNKYCLPVPFVIFIDLISTFRFRGGVDHMNFSCKENEALILDLTSLL